MNIFCKGPDSKYYYHNYTALMLWPIDSGRIQMASVCSSQTVFTKTGRGLDLSHRQ